MTTWKIECRECGAWLVTHLPADITSWLAGHAHAAQQNTAPRVDDLLGSDPGWTGDLSTDEYVAEQRRENADGLAQRHQQHYRSCGCLGGSAKCCDPTCPCHPKNANDGGDRD